MYRWARVQYMHAGGDPRVLAELPWWQIADYIAVADVLDARKSLGGLPDS